MSFADTARLITELVLNDKMTPGLNTAKGRLDQLQRSGEQLGRGIRQVGTGFTQLGTRAAVVAAGGLTAVVKTAIDFESAFAGVAKTVEATPAQLEELNSGFRELARTIPLSFEEFAAIGEQAGALGIAREDILEFTEVVAKIGTTTDVSSDEAATALGQLSNVLKLTAEDYDNFGAALVDLGNKGASTESQILAITSRAGAGAKLAGFAADETLAWASAVANLGVEAEAGGSALQQFTLQSVKNLEVPKRLALLAKTAGVTGKEFKKAFEDDASGALQTFLTGLGKLNRGEQLQVLDDLNLKGIRLQRVLLGLAGDQDNLADSLDNANDAWRENRALNEEAEKRYATTASALAIVKNNVRDAANTIGSELLPVIRDLSTEFVEFLNEPGTQRKIKAFAQDLGQGARDLVKAFKAGEFQPFIDSLKGAAGAAKIAFDAFNALPGPIKQVAIAAALANKATGGAVGLIASGATNIFKGLLGLGGGLLGKGGNPGNPLFVKEVGLGGGGTGLLAGAGRGGLLVTVGKFLGLAGAAGLGFEIGNAIGHQFFDSTVKPTQEREARQFDEFISDSRTSQADAARALGSIDDNLASLYGEDAAARGLLHLVVGNQIDQLEAQREQLRLIVRATPTGQFVPENLGGTPGTVPVKVTNKPLVDPVVFRELGAKITRKEEQVRDEVKRGDLAAARRHEREIEALHQARGSIRQGFTDVIPHLGKTNRALAVANRNLDDGNRRQRETAQRIAEARDRIGSGFRETADIQRGILRKPSSFTANIQTNVTAYLSATQALQVINTYQTIRHSSDTSTNTGGSI